MIRSTRVIFKINGISDKRIEDAYEKGMRELNEFWGIKSIIETPDVYVVQSREDINRLGRQETPRWLNAWIKDRIIYLLAFDNFKSESSDPISEERYSALIKHELCHVFFEIVAKGATSPIWLIEGLSLYTSNQLHFRKRPKVFKGFIEAKYDNPDAVYGESGFVVETLIIALGKDKLIELVKSLKKLTNLDEFSDKFKEIYEFELTYQKVNELFLKSSQD